MTSGTSDKVKLKPVFIISKISKNIDQVLLFSSGIIDHVITILITRLFIAVSKTPSAQWNSHCAEQTFTREKIILNAILAQGFD